MQEISHDDPTVGTTLFLGKDGLRPGWGCALFAVLVAVFTVAMATLLRLVVPVAPPTKGVPMTPSQMLGSEGILSVATLLATVAMARIENRSLAEYGLALHRLTSRLTGGACAGFAAISGLVALLWATHQVVLHGSTLHAAAMLRYACEWAACFALVACTEELLMRGYLLFTLARGVAFWPAAIVLSALFGFLHHTNPGESPVGLFSAAAVGLVFSLTIWYTGSIWWAFGFHAAWDWGQSYFWGTSDSGISVRGHLMNEAPVGSLLWSGGPTGPEGSLWVLVLLLAIACMVAAWGRSRGRAAIFRREPIA